MCVSNTLTVYEVYTMYMMCNVCLYYATAYVCMYMYIHVYALFHVTV